jgi:hypothetical protein
MRMEKEAGGQRAGGGREQGREQAIPEKHY